MVEIDGEEFFASFRDRRNVKLVAEVHGKSAAGASKPYGYKAAQRMSYAKERREMQRTQQQQDVASVSTEESDTEATPGSVKGQMRRQAMRAAAGKEKFGKPDKSATKQRKTQGRPRNRGNCCCRAGRK